MKRNDIEAEINAIRVDFYEKTKDMSPSERVAYLKAQVDPIHKKYGIRTEKSAVARDRNSVLSM